MWIAPPTSIAADTAVELEVGRFGVVGSAFDIGLYQGGTLVHALLSAQGIADDRVTVTVPASVPPGDYTLPA